MKKLLTLLLVVMMRTTLGFSQATITKSGYITANETWTSNNIYRLSGFVYVSNNATVTIQAGTIIKGEKSTKEVASGSTFDITTWFNTASFANATYTANTSVGLKDAFNLSAPDPLPVDTSIALTGADFTNPNLADGWFEQVAFRGAFGTTDWTEGWANWNPQSEAYTGIEVVIEPSSINIYPNPMNTSSTLELNLLESNEVNISITDLSGRLIREVLNEHLAAGMHRISLQLSELASGMYLVFIRSGEENQMIKLTVE